MTRSDSITWKLFGLLTRSERWEMLGVLLLSIVVAVFETAGVASVLPFMAVVMDPTAFERYAILEKFTEIIGVTDTKQRLVALGIAVGIVIVMSNAASAIAIWTQQRAAARIRARLSIELFRRFMFQPYGFHVTHDGPTLQSVMINDIDAFARVISSALQFTARACVVLALITLLLVQNPTVAIWTFIVLGGSYVIIFKVVRGKQAALGSAGHIAWRSRQRIVAESFAGVKELQVLGRESDAIARFGVHAKVIAYAHAGNFVLSSAPRYILEPIGFCGILAAALVLILTNDDAAASAIPTLALYAFVGYRLLPALQQIYSAAAEIKYSLPSVLSLHQYYADSASSPEVKADESRNDEPLLKDDVVISLDKVSFSYPGAERPALSSVSANIIRGKSVGIVGKSGSGKTTLADLILGLYLPQGGSIGTPDGTLDHVTVRRWQKRIGYVPQHVFLANASILENIAFGLPSEDIDITAAHRAARLAQATDFIKELPLGMDTVIGERGVVLSGGQRQRLGIARALYGSPEVLVFDEATSALDGLTESSVMDAIHSLSGERTVILIAHRLQTIEACSQIIHLSEGRVVDQGEFHELVRTSATFREFTNRSGPSRTHATIAGGM